MIFRMTREADEAEKLKPAPEAEPEEGKEQKETKVESGADKVTATDESDEKADDDDDDDDDDDAKSTKSSAEKPADDREGSQVEGDQPVEETKEEPKVPLYENPESLDEFRGVVDFFETYLAPDIKKIEAVRAHKATKIAYENLWMLFETGDTVCCPSRKGGIVMSVEDDEEHVTVQRDAPQAYRVVSVIGGMPRDPGPTATEQDLLRVRARDLYSVLMIDCYFLDFDGARYDAVAEKFHIKPFEGEVDITSLEVFPVGFDPLLTEDFFKKRGLDFLRSSTLFSHRLYEGLTAGESPEEINSPVIIDFLMAFQDGKRKRPTFTYPSKAKIKRDLKQYREIAGTGTCSYGPNCSICADDSYVLYQKDQLERCVNRLKDAIELYAPADSAVTRPSETICDDLVENDHISLLPGVVYAFALRNRAWCEFPFPSLSPAHLCRPVVRCPLSCSIVPVWSETPGTRHKATNSC
jgi:hypothetical protein